MGCQMGARKVTNLYHRSLVHSLRCEHERLKMFYEEEVISMTVEQFLKWSFKTRDTILDRKSIEWTAWLVLPPLYCMPNINYDGYLPKDRATDVVKTHRANKDMQNIHSAENNYLNYSSEQKFPNVKHRSQSW